MHKKKFVPYMEHLLDLGSVSYTHLYTKGSEPYRVRACYALDKRPPCLYRHHSHGQETPSLSHILPVSYTHLYAALENDLKQKIANIERTHSDYDEYRYNVDEIGDVYKRQDINYQLAHTEEQAAIFDGWSACLNYFDSTLPFQLSFINHRSRPENRYNVNISCLLYTSRCV